MLSESSEDLKIRPKLVLELLNNALELERDIIQAVELLGSNVNTLTSIRDFIHDYSGWGLGTDFGLEMESNIQSLRYCIERAKYLERRIHVQLKSVSHHFPVTIYLTKSL